MNFTRRETMVVSGAALAASILPIKLMASTTDLISVSRAAQKLLVME